MKKSILFLFTILMLLASCSGDQIMFPTEQPVDGNFNRPTPDQVMDVSPPGFSWWRAAPVGEVNYRLRIEDESGKEVYASESLGDPVHVPDIVLPPGKYQWFVDAINESEKVLGTREPQNFTIAENALELPWVEPAELLNRVPDEHPRLLFTYEKLAEVRASLSGSRKDAYKDIRYAADEALKLELMEKPDFDKFDRETEYPARRTAYRASYHEFTAIYNRGMVPLALMYQLSGEEKYGLAAKKHLLNVLDWELEGVSSLEESFDEVGLRIARTCAQGYDWLYDILTEDEREAVKQMLLARGDQMLARMEGKDFLNKSAYSHDGRLPGYLVEFSIALAEEERAEVWMDYAMRALLTVFPHWGGKDGGWAEGIHYVLSYNDRFITPLQSLYEATGYDLWNKSYFRNMRHFLMYCISPVGEITPFGDSEHNPLAEAAGEIYSILQFHSLKYKDPAARWWIETLKNDRDESDRLGALHRIILEDNLLPEKPESIEQDKAFFGIGWAALHTDILNPEKDLMFLFKSSPYGAVSHGHANQNGFAIMKGGKALANPTGARYPQHFSPFHFEYSILTVAHNALLVNGEGQINRDGSAGGSLVDFKSTPNMSYVAGDAEKCYGERLDSYNRHVIMIKPSVILIIDNLAGTEPVSVDWLMHCREEMMLDPENQVIHTTRLGEEMKTQLLTGGGLDFSMTNEWPFDPKKDYPMVTAPRPAKEWHFTATTREKSSKKRIAAIMTVAEDGIYPVCDVKTEGDLVYINGEFGDDKWSGLIRLGTEDEGALLELEYHPAEGETETIKITD